MSIKEDNYLRTSKIAFKYDVSTDYFYALKSSGEVKLNKHYIQKGKLLRWNIDEIDNLLKGDNNDVDSLVSDLLEKIEV